MDKAQLRFIFDRYKQADNTKKRGLLQIEVRLTGTNKRKLISTGIHLYKNQFSDKNGFTCKNHDNAPAITGKAARMFRKIEAFVFSDRCNSLNDVKNWNEEEAQLYSFVEFMREQLRRRDPSMATIEHHSVLIRKLEDFGKIKTFADVNYANITDFDSFLRKSIKSSATLNKRHSALHYYIKEAINRDLIKKDPYFQFKIPSKKSKDPVFLNEKEIKLIQDYNPEMNRLIAIKDIFIFQIFTGLAFVDLMNFSKDYISEIDGKKVIKSSRTKTDESFISLFLPEAEAIADKYNYELPKISNQKYNDYLKLLAAGAGIKKNLTSHVARHTFATYLLNKDVPIETVSRALGHTNLKMTQHYARMLGKKVISDMSKLIE